MHLKLWTTTVALVLLWTHPISAQENVHKTRTITQFGTLASWGSETAFSQPGFGAAGVILTYFDADTSNGMYYGLLTSGNLAVSQNGFSLTDTKILTLGWRQSIGNSALSFDVNASPVWGARYNGSQVLGTSYAGFSCASGIFLPIFGNFDLGIECESVVNLATFGAPTAKNLSYTNVVLYVAFKSNFETKSIPW